MQAYRIDKSIGAGVADRRERCWPASGREPGAEQVVRSTARLAGQLNADWHAVYVETPQLQRLPEAQRERILRDAASWPQELGATTATLAGNDVARGARRLRARATTSRRSCSGAAPAGAGRWRAAAAEAHRRLCAGPRRDRDRPPRDERRRRPAMPTSARRPHQATRAKQRHWRLRCGPPPPASVDGAGRHAAAAAISTWPTS